MSLYGFKARDISGAEFDFGLLKGKVALIVNSASKCGYTPQLKELEELHKKYKNQGLEVIAFPSNSFYQEVSNDQVLGFCQKNYGVTFKVMETIDVNGENAHPVYEFMKSQRPGILGLTRIKWNFEKFLIDRQGNVTERFSSMVKPADIGPKIEALLNVGVQ
jgi:glutathione peroxidase